MRVGDRLHAGFAFAARLLAARLRPGRAASGGDSSGPNSARLRTSCGATMREMERDDRAHRMRDDMRALDASAAQTRIIAWTKRSIDSGPSTRCERPEPGRSGRTVRWRTSAGISGVQTFDVPPRP